MQHLGAEMDWGREAARRLTHMSGIASLQGPGVTRLPFTDQHRAAIDVITGWMHSAGLKVHMDAAGTLVGRRDGPKDAQTLLIGSHQDSVPGGGAYDGIMGVALACLALEALRDRPLPVAVEVLAFADEEGVRFPTALIGPRALAGTFDPGVLDMTDRDGTTLAEALRDFGGSPDAVRGLARSPAGIAGYIELHIEQGPVLEAMAAPVGLVTAICGIERHEVRFSGVTGHAGTVPMEARQDALVAAAAFVSDVPRKALAWPGLRATVGTLQVRPGAPNAIPEAVTMVLEVRSERDSDRAAAIEAFQALAERSAVACGCAVTMTRTYEQAAVICDADLSAVMRDAAETALPELPSGATHDASAMADLCAIAMLFLRCRGGVSHRPDEFASAEDMGIAVDLLARALAEYAPPQAPNA